ncbi:hypothetical protein pdul_cds_534 [Pandoravirus dulcis]|uniref:DUF5860 domain-containing protein n=1 Tax=Pandoravirus dulcis TaxID=1349409 RepID=S4VT96_9VIRU|nr:hypothetical protein pdul_cds_534 [Pandoravirus dulcis]AGO82635.1 hypothetical protein pdul_cds_534 [Pandoravirus dulcis]
MNPTVSALVCARGSLPSDSTLRDMYGPLDQKDIDRMAQVSAALDVPHDWSPCDDAGAVGVGPGMFLCITTRHIVDNIACDFACSVHLGRERRVALGVRQERHGWVLYFAVIPGADLPGAMIVPAGTFGSPPGSKIAAAVQATYPKMDSPSCSVVAGLCGAMSAHAQRWLPPYVLDRTALLQSVWVTENDIAKAVRALAKAVNRSGSGARRLVLSPRSHEFQSSLLHLSYATEPIDADEETADRMEEGTVDETALLVRTQSPVTPPSGRHQATDQSPVALLGLYPDMTTAEAVCVLAIADSLADVPHQWTAQPAGDVSIAVHDLGAPLALVKKTVHLVGQRVGGQRRVLLCALRRHGAYTHLRVAAERPASTPRVQTADDLLDLYPDVTAREIVALARVIAALTGTPTEWVPSASGHDFDGQGPFAPTESVAQRIADAVRPLVLSRSSSDVGAVPHHAVLTIDRDQHTRDLVYRFAIVPTPSTSVC